MRFGVRAPDRQLIYAAGAYYPGLPILGPVCIRPPSLHSPVSNPEPPETGMCMALHAEDAAPRRNSVHNWLSTCTSAGRLRVLACAARGA